MKRGFKLLFAAFAVLGLAQAPAAAGAGADVFGVWRNPKNSVHVELKPCGESACGYVVWANEKAQADARKGGTEDLIGMQIFRQMEPTADGGWKGKVFVPDLNITVSGRAEPIDDNQLRAKGCLIIICKSQIWTRLS